MQAQHVSQCDLTYSQAINPSRFVRMHSLNLWYQRTHRPAVLLKSSAAGVLEPACYHDTSVHCQGSDSTHLPAAFLGQITQRVLALCRCRTLQRGVFCLQPRHLLPQGCQLGGNRVAVHGGLVADVAGAVSIPEVHTAPPHTEAVPFSQLSADLAKHCGWNGSSVAFAFHDTFVQQCGALPTSIHSLALPLKNGNLSCVSAHLSVFRPSSRLMSAGLMHAIMTVLELPPSES